MKVLKFKVGDRVRVKTGIVPSVTFDTPHINSDMPRLGGQISTINGVSGHSDYDWMLNSSAWHWCEEWLGAADPVMELEAELTKALAEVGRLQEEIKKASVEKPGDQYRTMNGCNLYTVHTVQGDWFAWTTDTGTRGWGTLGSFIKSPEFLKV